MNKLLQHLIDSGDVSHKVLPSLMKFQMKGEVPTGLKPIPRSGGDIASLPQVQKQIILSKDQLAKNKAAVAQRVASENAKILAERKARLAGAEKAKSQPFSAKQLAEETQATGDKLRLFPNDPNSFIDDYLNPGVFIGNMASGLGRVPLNVQEGNYTDAALAIGTPLAFGAAEALAAPYIKKGADFVKNNVYRINPNKEVLQSKVYQTFGPNNSNSGLLNFLKAPAAINPVGIAADHGFGILKGGVEQAKGLLSDMGVLKNSPARRPFFETFPVTKAQRAKVMAMQDEALVDAQNFTNDYWYGNSLDVRPVLEDKMRNILPQFKMAKYNNNLERGNSPFGKVPDLLVRNTTWGKGREGLSQDMINYLNNNRGSIGGVNTDEASITLRNMGLYYKTPREIANTVAHESGHSAQNFAVMGEFDTSPYTISDYSKKTWGEQLAEADPNYNYYTSNPNTEIGKRFQAALVSPKKSFNPNGMTKQTWRSSPNEVHSELMASKYNMYKQGLRQGYTPEQMMEKVTNPGQKELEWLLDNKTINKHFKKGTSREERLALLKLLPAAVPAVAGAATLQQQKEGGELMRMQWAGQVSSKDSVRNMAGKILKYEQLRGGPGGTSLPQYADPKYMDMLMNNIYPEVKKIMPQASAMETGEAMDFIFNAGWDKTAGKIQKDPRAYAIQEYYKKNDPSKLDPDGKWSGRKNPAYSFDQEYNATIGKLSENERRVLMNKGRDWYYKNINNPAPGVPSSDYNDTWFGRIWNTNDYAPFNASDPRFVPKKEEGGEKTEYKGPSIVDYLATKGYSGKKAFRKDLASKYGVEDYDYSARKNTELLNRMRENDDLLETFKQNAAPVSAESLEQMYRANLEAKKQENYNNIRRRMALDMGYDPLAGQGQFEQAQYPELSLIPKNPNGKNSLVNGLQGTGRQLQGPAVNLPTPQQQPRVVPPTRPNGKPLVLPPVNAWQPPGWDPYIQQPAPASNRNIVLPTYTPPTYAPPSVQKEVPAPVSLVSGPENFQFQQFPAYPTRQVADLPKKTTAKAAAKALEEDIDEESWFEKAGSAIEDGMEYASGLINGLQRKWDSTQKEDPRSIKKINTPIKIDRGLPGKTTGNKKDSASAIPYGYKQLYAVADSKNPKDSLVSFMNTFDNEQGGRYYIGHKAKEVTDAGAQSSFDNAEGVAHFLRDSDILPGQKITPKSWEVSKGYTYHTTSPGKTVSAAGLDDPNKYRMLYRPNPKNDGTYLVKYVRNKEISPIREAQLRQEGWEQDFTVNAQHKFSDIAWEKDGPSTGYAAASKWLPLKDGKHTYIPYKSKDGFSRFSGGSGIYLFVDPKTGKQVGVDVSGSVNTIKKIGDELIKSYGVKPEDLELAYHDMGSYSAKPKSHNGKLDYKQWLDYNTYNRGFSGAPMVIPRKNNGGPIVDPRGQWAHPGKVTRIPSNQITMQGVPYPVYGVGNNGQSKMMYPGQDYDFGGASYVDEYPMMQLGGGSLLTPDYFQVGKNMMEIFSAPQKALTALFSGKYQEPSEALGVQNPWGAFAINAVLDPVNIVGAGLSKMGLKALKGSKATKAAANFAGKAANPELSGTRFTVKQKPYKFDASKIENLSSEDQSNVSNAVERTVNALRDNAEREAYRRHGNYKKDPITGKLNPVLRDDMYMDMMMNFPDVNLIRRNKFGGSLPAYQIKGQVAPSYTDNTRVAPKIDKFEIMKTAGKRTVKDQFNEAMQFQKAWMQSLIYKKMIKTSDPKNVDDINERREKGLLYATAKFDPFQLGNETTGGFAQGTDITLLPNGLKTIGSLAHEVSHAADSVDEGYDGSRAIPNSDINRINFYKTKNLKEHKKKEGKEFDQEWYDYVTEPTETRARLNTIRQAAHLNKLYDPFTQKVTPEIYKKLRDFEFEPIKTGFDPLWQLKGVYSDQQIIDLLNSVSKNNSQAGMDQARYGGGLLSRSVSCSSCGHSWKSVDGGGDPLHCHKCGGMVKMKAGGEMIRRADGSYSQRGLWDNVRANKGSGKKPTKQMLEQERKIKKAQWGLEFKVDDWLGKPMEKAEMMADKFTKPGNDQTDNFRHPMAGRYASEAIQRKTGNIPVLSNILGFIGGSAAGLGHELLDPNRGPDKRPYTLGQTIREGAEDQFNNMVGALIGSLPFMSATKKTQTLKYLSDNNLIPDGYGRNSDNMYFKKMGGKVPKPFNGKQPLEKKHNIKVNYK